MVWRNLDIKTGERTTTSTLYPLCVIWTILLWYFFTFQKLFCRQADTSFALLTASSITSFGLSEKIWDNMETDVLSGTALVPRLSRSRTLVDGLVTNKNDNYNQSERKVGNQKCWVIQQRILNCYVPNGAYRKMKHRDFDNCSWYRVKQ